MVDVRSWHVLSGGRFDPGSGSTGALSSAKVVARFLFRPVSREHRSHSQVQIWY
jgi:hypothetical protein